MRHTPLLTAISHCSPLPIFASAPTSREFRLLSPRRSSLKSHCNLFYRLIVAVSTSLVFPLTVESIILLFPFVSLLSLTHLIAFLFPYLTFYSLSSPFSHLDFYFNFRHFYGI
ncbi:hypothetical protein GALMADRAFT_1159681 [Galerina marginata CBS 339.88]|uniref:Uncharacterized protein n=1 Tax=Galerina marginata (strain CBS 339.88) TaxID=685588 RepID=A0A067SF76_GALM3|nr:hypothetical protein GALMADRAFT_1159681 [Galerina marginata CBS 339.88]